jgi:chemotaxis protein methyltransferase CheR
MTSRTTGAVPLAEVERVLEEACGLTLSPGIRRTLGDAFARAARDLRLAPEPFLGKLRAREHRAVTTLVEAAVVGETYFFRHPEQLAAIRQLVIAPAQGRPLSIWSAGCATGEEPYTLAMELCDAGRTGLADRILATDVSSRALAVAREARYGEWSLRRLDPVVRNRHFESTPPQVVVRPPIRAMVEFRRHNLVREPAPGTGFDLVVCRNVLIYFNPPTAALVVEKLAVSLAPGGLLVLGPVEAPLAAGQTLERIELEGVTIFRAPGGRALTLPTRPRASGVDRARGERPAPPERPSEGKRHGGKKQAAAPRPATPPEAPAPPPPPPPAAPAGPGSLAAARDAALRGDLSAAEELARSAATRELCPEAWLLVSMAADARGDLPAAVDAVRRALYLDPGLALGHAALVPLYARLGLPGEAARARRNALEALAGLDDGAPLRGVETITAGALRSALEAQSRPAGRGVHAGSRG